MNYLFKTSFVLIISILYTSCLYASTRLNKTEITQWVKITSQISRTGFYFNTHVDDLESSKINCGYDCEIVKLSTTPFTTNGTLNLKIGNNCTSTTVKFPFNAEDNYLVTSLKTYRATIGSEYCGFQYVNVTVSGDHRASTGYQINLDSADYK